MFQLFLADTLAFTVKRVTRVELLMSKVIIWNVIEKPYIQCEPVQQDAQIWVWVFQKFTACCWPYLRCSKLQWGRAAHSTWAICAIKFVPFSAVQKYCQTSQTLGAIANWNLIKSSFPTTFFKMRRVSSSELPESLLPHRIHQPRPALALLHNHS